MVIDLHEWKLLTMETPGIFPLLPQFREMVWGGRGLETLFGKALPEGSPIGESWEVSALSGMESQVAAGPAEGVPLSALIQEHGEGLLGEGVFARYGGEFPLLIKLLDACQDLSIQVHPNDEYASTNNLGRFGKSEAWYVLRSDAGRIVLGLEEGIGRTEFALAISENRIGETIKCQTVQAGDLVCLPPGTVHALCQGVMIYEVQQSSDITFRIHDYDRLGLDGKPREIHTEQALQVIDFQSTPEVQSPADDAMITLLETEHFKLERCRLNSETHAHPPYESFATATLLEGVAEIQSGQDHYRLGKGDTCLISARCPFEIAHQSDSQVEYLIASVP
jgi:mannose-6-phosphate isomerase